MNKTPQSQLAIMSGAVATSAPQSQLARFIAADLKGGESKHNFGMTIIAGAINQALKGNQRDIPEAVKLCQGKSKKARAYCAGFQAIINDLSPVKYAGKLDAPVNAAAREQIALRSQALEFAFEGAYLIVINEPAAPKAAKVAAKEPGDVVASVEPVMAVVADHVTVELGTSVDAVCRALDQALLEPGEVLALRLALEQFDNSAAGAASAAAAAAAIAAAAATMTSAEPALA